MGRLPSNPNVNSKTCTVCQHPERYQIEQLVLSIGPSSPTLTLDAIADAYGISSQDLRVHALMHTPLALDFSSESEASLVENFKLKAGVTSPQDGEVADASSHQPTPDDASALNKSHVKDRLTDKINLREGDMLIASANELLTTLDVLGRRIKRFATDGGEGSDQRLVNFCTNAMVSLYTGTASELRKTIDSINDMNVKINGAHDNSTDSLKELAKAIRGSDSAVDSE